jgi:hypothetical protein
VSEEVENEDDALGETFEAENVEAISVFIV